MNFCANVYYEDDSINRTLNNTAQIIIKEYVHMRRGRKGKTCCIGIKNWQHHWIKSSEGSLLPLWLVMGKHIYLVRGDHHRENNPTIFFTGSWCGDKHRFRRVKAIFSPNLEVPPKKVFDRKLIMSKKVPWLLSLLAWIWVSTVF